MDRGGHRDGSRGALATAGGTLGVALASWGPPRTSVKLGPQGAWGSKILQIAFFAWVAQSCLWVQCLGSETRTPWELQWPQPDGGCMGGVALSSVSASVRHTLGRLLHAADSWKSTGDRSEDVNSHSHWVENWG